MYCENCGAEIEGGNKFCQSCGAPITGSGANAEKGNKPESVTQEEPKGYVREEPKSSAQNDKKQTAEQSPDNNVSYVLPANTTDNKADKVKNGLGKFASWFKRLSKGKKIAFIVGVLVLLSLIFGGHGASDKNPSVETTTTTTTTEAKTTETTQVTETTETTTNELQSKAKEAGENLANSLLDSFNDKITGNKKDVYGCGETFKFEGFDITLGTSVSVTTVNNQFSEYNGKSVLKVPFTMTNNNNETASLNFLYVSYFGSNGVEVDGVDAYFKDSISFMGDIRSGSTGTFYAYIPYDGNGTYSVEFDNWSEKVTVEFDVNK